MWVNPTHSKTNPFKPHLFRHIAKPTQFTTSIIYTDIPVLSWNRIIISGVIDGQPEFKSVAPLLLRRIWNQRIVSKSMPLFPWATTNNPIDFAWRVAKWWWITLISGNALLWWIIWSMVVLMKQTVNHHKPYNIITLATYNSIL